MSNARNALKRETGINYKRFQPELTELHAAQILIDHRSGRLTKVAAFLRQHYEAQNQVVTSHITEFGETIAGRYSVRETTYGNGRIEITVEEG